MTAPAQPQSLDLVGVVLDTPDVAAAASWWSRLLGVPAEIVDQTWAKLAPHAGSAHLSYQLEPRYVRPVWPAAPGEPQMSIHLDFLVASLPDACAWAEACGAVRAEFQPQDDCWVYLDPDGHPFCLTSAANW